jgi:hypothetical protein
MAMMSLIEKLFGASAAASRDATKLDGTSEAALARSLSALPPDEAASITFAEASRLRTSNTRSGEADDDGSKILSHSRRGTTPVSASCRLDACLPEPLAIEWL